ncbi:unnamed protein product [Urochloa humidicola]
MHHVSQEDIMEKDLLHLPTDIIYKILMQISDPASIVCAASSCKLWRNIIMGSSFLDGLKKRRLSHGFAPSLLLGFFYQDNTQSSLHLWQRYKKKGYSLEPGFIPTSILLPATGRKEGHNAVRPLSLGTFIEGFVASLNFYEPIASQNNLLVLYHRSRDATVPDVVCVCNPLTGEVFHIPDLPYRPQPDKYALLVTDDASLDGQVSQSFRLVAVLTTGNRIFYSYYCSKSRSWWKPSTSPEIMPGLFVVSSSASSGHGCIHWLCGDLKSSMVTHVVTLHVDREELLYLELPSEAKGKRLLANSADGGVLLLILNDLHMSLWKHKSEFSSDTSDWVFSQMINMADYLPINTVLPSRAKVTLEIFRGKSGAVVLWVEKEGIFLFSLSDRSVRKLDNDRVTAKYRLCPYEIDWVSCLAVTNLVADGSSSLDVGRKKVQGRWRTLMTKVLRKAH